jgi:hypothetical protein
VFFSSFIGFSHKKATKYLLYRLLAARVSHMLVIEPQSLFRFEFSPLPFYFLEVVLF